MKKETSLFHNYGNFEKVQVKENIAPWDDSANDGTAQYGKKIMRVLKKYSLLNRQSILKALQLNNRNNWKTERLPKTLKALRRSGLVDMYQMGGRPEDEQALSVYQLSEDGFQYLENEKEIINPAVSIANTQECLTRLTLNQWHINLLYILENNVQNAFYDSFVVKDGKTVPSMVKYNRSGRTGEHKGLKESISLFAYPAPHKEEYFEEFMLQIIASYEFLIEHPLYRPAIIILLCENMNHAAWVSWKLNKVKEMRPLNAFIYALDIMTKKEKMLSFLYSCDADEEGMVRSNVSLL